MINIFLLNNNLIFAIHVVFIKSMRAQNSDIGKGMDK